MFLGYSPERINPGDKKHTLSKITKVVSGSNPEISEFIKQLYDRIITAGIFKASSIKIAEAAKVIENIQRDVNIALINELSMIFEKLNIDTHEVLQAAGTKWNFLPFKPGLVGGHCIGVDPYYLTYKSLELGYTPDMILAGRKINEGMSRFISEKTINQMIDNEIKPEESTIAIFGLSFKENCPDLRNSKTVDLINSLKEYNSKIIVTDPLVDKDQAKKIYGIELVDIEKISKIDTIILSVAHDTYKDFSLDFWKSLLSEKSLFIDIKSVFNKEFFKNTSISYWRP